MTVDPIDRVLAARTAAELFGTGDVEVVYKQLQRQVHPDLNPARASESTAAFVKLNELYLKFKKGSGPTSFTTKKGVWEVAGDIWRSSGVRYRSVVGTEDTWLAYVSDTRITGSFVEGHRILENLTRELLEKDLKETTTTRYFFPRILDKFKLGDKQKEARVLSAELPDTRWFPLSQWTSMDPKDIAWIARRGLIALDLVHKNGSLHGSPHLEAFVIEPEKHGLMLKDWQYAIRKGDPITNVDPKAVPAYPSWVKSIDSTKDGKLDLIVFADAFGQLAKLSAAPPWFQDFFSQLKANPPKEAVVALHQLTELLDQHWERRFHPMAYPR